MSGDMLRHQWDKSGLRVALDPDSAIQSNHSCQACLDQQRRVVDQIIGSQYTDIGLIHPQPALQLALHKQAPGQDQRLIC